jgi:hypothetical protein
VDGLAYSLHHPMACSCHMMGHGFLSSIALSNHVAVGGDAFLGDAKPLGLHIEWSVDHLDTCVTKSYME